MLYQFDNQSHPTRPVPTTPTWGPEPNGIALGQSGRVYVTVGSRDEIVVLDGDGHLLDTICNPLFDYPVSLAFMGARLLVTNYNLGTIPHPDKWNVLTVNVDDTGVPSFAPTNLPIGDQAHGPADTRPFVNRSFGNGAHGSRTIAITGSAGATRTALCLEVKVSNRTWVDVGYARANTLTPPGSFLQSTTVRPWSSTARGRLPVS